MFDITLLSDDLLADILILSTNVSVEEKFTIARVSRRWRSLALSSPLLWSSFCLSTEMDYARLPIILERSGSSAPLDVELLAPLKVNLSSDDDWRPVMQALAPYATRIRSFYAHVVDPDQEFAPRLDGNLDFPILEDLMIFTQNLADDDPLPVVHARAPALRVLELGTVDIRNLAALLCPTLTMVRLLHCSPASNLLSILQCCPHLVYLSFCNVDVDEDTAFPGLATITRRPLAPELRSLSLRIPLRDVVKVLDTGFADVIIPDIVVAISNGDNESDIARLVGSLLRGLGPLVSFELHDNCWIVLRDTNGHERSMGVWGEDSHWDVTALWTFLAAHYAITTSVRNIQVNTSSWNDLAAALEEHPLQTPEGAGITMHIFTSWDDEWDERIGFLYLRKISVPRLCHLELTSPHGNLPSEIVRHLLWPECLQFDYCDGAQACRVVIHAPKQQESGDVERDLKYFADWQKSIRYVLEYASWASRWELSFE